MLFTPENREFTLIMALILALHLAASSHIVWPTPRYLACYGPPLRIDSALTISSAHKSDRLERAILRTSTELRAWASGAKQLANAPSLSKVNIEVTSPTQEDEVGVSERTAYNYSIQASPAGVVIRAPSIYGAMYGLESLTQLVDASNGMLLVRP